VFSWAESPINGFFGIFAVALTVTVVHRLADWTFVRLGRSPTLDQATSERS
jgi:hypothetical protein